MIYHLDEGDGKLYTESSFLDEFRYTFRTEYELKELFKKMPQIEVEEEDIPSLRERLAYIYQSSLPPVGSIISRGMSDRQWYVESLEGRTVHVRSINGDDTTKIWEGPYLILSTVLKNL